MNLGEQLLSAFAQYGVPLLCIVTVVGSAGAPLPLALLYIAAGSFADHGEMNLYSIIGFGTLASIGGDQLGFWIGRWGGRKLASRIGRWIGGPDNLGNAEARVMQWGSLGIFLTRWLITPIGPAVNLVSGFAGFPWHKFLLWDVLGEFLFVVLYVAIGKLFSHQVQEVSSLMDNASWSALGFAVAAFLAWKLYSSRKKKAASQRHTSESALTEPLA